MLPIRWDPLRELSTFHRDIDNLFRRTFGLGRGETVDVISPVVNTYMKGGQFHIDAEIPGVNKNDLEVRVEGNVLTLKGERKDIHETKEEHYLLKESRYGSFLRQIELPPGVDTEKIEAAYDNGVLRVSMPVEEKAISGRKIEIAGGAGEKLEETHKVH